METQDSTQESTQESTQAELVESVVAAVAGDVRALAEWLVEHRAADLREQEKGLVERGHRLLTRLLGEVLAERERETSRGGAWCPRCGEVGVWLRARRKTLHLLVGDVPLVRECGYCHACRATWAPLDDQLGVDQSGRSPRLVEALALVGAELAFSPAAERLGQLCGVWLSYLPRTETPGHASILHKHQAKGSLRNNLPP